MMMRNRITRRPFFLLRDGKGFTLIEIMVVMVILGILAGLIVPRIMDRPEEARRTKAVIQIQSIEQALFYLRGIFKGAPHPFEKTPTKKLNPLQQLTYFAILNVLLPLQGLTGNHDLGYTALAPNLGCPGWFAFPGPLPHHDRMVVCHLCRYARLPDDHRAHAPGGH